MYKYLHIKSYQNLGKPIINDKIFINANYCKKRLIKVNAKVMLISGEFNCFVYTTVSKQ